MKKLQSLGKIAALSVATVFALTQPAKAVLFNTFEFTDENGYGAVGRVPGETVTGTITFNGLNPGDSATGVAADSVVVDSIPNWYNAWGDATDMQVGINLVPFINGENILGATEINSFNVNNGTIATGESDFIAGLNDEALALAAYDPDSGVQSFISADNASSAAWDADSSSLSFSQTSASVPFEFSPTLGLFLVGGLFGISRYAKSRKAAKLIDNQ